uniref:Protein BIC1 n=1 Tax=Setaria italica TaxID=4555 RepID=K3Z0Q6_SETIT
MHVPFHGGRACVNCAYQGAEKRPPTPTAGAEASGPCKKSAPPASTHWPWCRQPAKALTIQHSQAHTLTRSLPDCGGGELVAARRPAAEESARERLKRHRTEMAGRVRIPEMWGQERLLKDWVDCAVFDRPLAATAGLLTARDALVAECAAARRPAVSHGPTGRPLRVQNGCS